MAAVIFLQKVFDGKRTRKSLTNIEKKNWGNRLLKLATVNQTRLSLKIHVIFLLLEIIILSRELDKKKVKTKMIIKINISS